MEKKCLIAFDFDHTIIDNNSDVHVQRLAPGGKLPQEIKQLYREDGWTEYMGAIFAYLHQTGSTKENIAASMDEIKLVAGMDKLFDFLKSDAFDVIIISDANSVFIDMIMTSVGLKTLVKNVYTNPAEFDDNGCLTIQYYHLQDWCKLSTKNLCKGHILEQHIAERAKAGVRYDQVAFVGDGSNDLCPSLRLREQDLVFARKGYKLLKLLNKDDLDLKASVVPWDNAEEILNRLKESVK